MNYQERADYHAQRTGIDRNLFRSLINQESRWNPNAVSPVGAVGLGQVMPDTAKAPGFGVQPLANAYDPEENLRFSADYLSALNKRYKGNTNKTLAAYNWGAGNADKWDGQSMDALPKETRDYIQKIGAQPAFDPSQGPSMSFAADQNQQAQPGFDNGAFYGLINEMYPEDKPKEPSKFDQWVTEKLPWLTDDRSEALLAIGSGLLSGDDWQSGMAGVAQNLQGLNKQRKDEGQAKQRQRQEALMEAAKAERDHFYKMRTQGDAMSKGYARPLGNVELEDGTILSDVTWRPDGTYADSQGNLVNMKGARVLNNSDAYGSKATPSFNDIQKSQAAILESRHALEAMDRALDYFKGNPTQGISRMTERVDEVYRTLIGRGLTDAQIQRAIVTGDGQALIGMTREDTVGPGVMTEADAVRVMMALGGDFSSLMANPSALVARLEVVHHNTSTRYEQLYNQYENTRSKYPRIGMEQLERYQPVNKTEPREAPAKAPASYDPKSTGIPWDQLDEEDRRALMELEAASLDQSNGQSQMGPGALSQGVPTRPQPSGLSNFGVRPAEGASEAIRDRVQQSKPNRGIRW